MGLQFSRLALAVALSMQLVAPLHAAEQLDEFYIEIKGPDKAAPTPLVPEMSQPAVAPAPVKNQAQPAPVPTKPKAKRPRSTMKVGVPQPFVNSAPVDNGPSAGVYGPVKSSDTLWSIAKQARPGNQVSVSQTLLAIYRKNPQAFAGGRVSGLYKGARLNLPTLAQVRAESEAQAQQLIRSGSLKLTAPKSVKPAVSSETTAAVAAQAPVTESPATVAEPTAAEKPSRVIKLSPPATSAAEATQAQEVAKPVVKLTPSNPGLAAAEPAPVSVSAAVATSAASTATTEDLVSNKLVIPSQPLGGVDASVSALVATTASGGTPTVDPNWQQAYQGKMDELAKANGQLASQVNQLTQDVAQLKTLLAAKASAALTSASAAVGATDSAEEREPATQEEGFWSQLVSTPLNLGLMLLLPFLLALALVSLWLMARSKRDQAARELEDAESAELMMAHGDSHFDHLLAADMVAMPDLPDLEQQDETVQPQPEIVLSERKEPAFTIPTSFALNETGKTTSSVDPELVPELSEMDLDLSVPTPAASSEAEWPRALNEPLDESEFLSELGGSESQSEPVNAQVSAVASQPVVPEVVAPVVEPFTPREEVKLSNDELDALFESADELEAEPFATMDSAVGGAGASAAELDEEEAEVEDASIAASLDELNRALEPQSTEPEEAPVADWYNEEPVVDLSAPVAADDIDALLAQSAPAAKPAFKGIDELLAEAEESGEKDEPYQGLSLDVGLDEFPEVLPDSDGVDVDLDSELGAKLDLARAYLEIDDKSSAIELLNEVLAAGSSVQKDEAQRLLKRLA